MLQNTIKIQKPMENDYLWFQGTSMASPHAAGVAALIVGEGITNRDEVERIMKETAVHPGGKKWDKKFGAGIIDARAGVTNAHADYAPERGGLAFVFGLFALGGIGLASARGRSKMCGLLGLGAAAAVASGAFGFAQLALRSQRLGTDGGLVRCLATHSPPWSSSPPRNKSLCLRLVVRRAGAVSCEIRQRLRAFLNLSGFGDQDD